MEPHKTKPTQRLLLCVNNEDKLRDKKQKRSDSNKRYRKRVRENLIPAKCAPIAPILIPVDKRPTIIKVGTKTGRSLLSYKNIEYNTSGWANPSKYLPIDYDLCSLKTKRGVVSGWFSGYRWEGIRLKHTDTVLGWKMISLNDH